MQRFFKSSLNGINLNKMHLNRPYVGYGWVFKGPYCFFFPLKRRLLFFFPVGRDSFVRYFPVNPAFLLQRDENETQGQCRFSLLSTLPAFLGDGRRQRKNHFSIGPGRQDGSRQTCSFSARESLSTWFSFYEARIRVASLQ